MLCAAPFAPVSAQPSSVHPRPPPQITSALITSLAKSRVLTGLPMCGVCPACLDRDCLRIQPERRFKNMRSCVRAREALRSRKERGGTQGTDGSAVAEGAAGSASGSGEGARGAAE